MSNQPGQDPAFPLGMELLDRMTTINLNPIGMSKHFYAACAAMQGILASQQNFGVLPDGSSDEFVYLLCKDAHKFARELLKQESNEKS